MSVIARTIYVCDRVSCPHYGEPMTYPCHEDGHAWREVKMVPADQLEGAVDSLDVAKAALSKIAGLWEGEARGIAREALDAIGGQ